MADSYMSDDEPTPQPVQRKRSFLSDDDFPLSSSLGTPLSPAAPPPIPRRSSRRDEVLQPLHLKPRPPAKFNFSYPIRRQPSTLQLDAFESRSIESNGTDQSSRNSGSYDGSSVVSSHDTNRSSQSLQDIFRFDTNATNNTIPSAPNNSSVPSLASSTANPSSSTSSFSRYLRKKATDSSSLQIERRISVDQRSERFNPRSSEESAPSQRFESSSYDTSALTVEEIHKLRKKGINPALYAEMKAARKGKGKWLSPLVGNSFIG